jgi:hypothetical protein
MVRQGDSAVSPAAAGPPQRLGDELVGDPSRDVGGVGRAQAEGDVPEIGVERLATLQN